jgi:hypothetical protein
VLIGLQKSLARTVRSAQQASRSDSEFAQGERPVYMIDGLDIELNAALLMPGGRADGSLLVDLNAPPSASNPHPHTLRSFGGRPQRFTFTDPLNLPGGTRRLLVVETELDVAIVDLLRPETPEITIQLTSGQDTRQLRPAGVVVSDGEAARSDDARIAIRLANDNTVLLAQMVPAEGRDFRPDLNLIDVGGVAADAAFVRTDGGALALAVLVPQRATAVLIDRDVVRMLPMRLLNTSRVWLAVSPSSAMNA